MSDVLMAFRVTCGTLVCMYVREFSALAYIYFLLTPPPTVK